MAKFLTRGVVLSLIPVLLASFARAAAPDAGSDGVVKVLVTNDVHGHIFEDAGQGRIGLAILAGYADETKKQAPTFLLDAGDAFSGSALTQSDSGRTVARLMGEMGYRILSPGNHAFDFNASEGNPLYYPETLVRTVSDSSPGPVEALSLNLTWRGGPVPGVGKAPAVIHEEAGLRLVVAGVITPYAASKINRRGAENFGFGLVKTPLGRQDHAATKKQLLETLELALAPYNRPGDIVIVLSHVGWDHSADYARGQVSGKDLAAVPNVDVLVDAHAHFLVRPERIGGAWYGQAGRYLEHFAEITLRRTGGTGEGWTADLSIRDYADVKDMAPSLAVVERLREASDRMALGDELFFVEDDSLFGDAGVNSENLPLGRLLCRAITEITGADAALYNSGGIRSGFSSGWVTAGALYDAIPFQNNLLTFSMTGEEVLELFNNLPPRGDNGFPQFYGMTAHGYEEDGELHVIGVLDANGVPLSPSGKYRVAVNSYMASGGDGFSFELSDQDRDFGDAATLIVDHFRKNGLENIKELREAKPLRLFSCLADAESAWKEKQDGVRRRQ